MSSCWMPKWATPLTAVRRCSNGYQQPSPEHPKPMSHTVHRQYPSRWPWAMTLAALQILVQLQPSSVLDLLWMVATTLPQLYKNKNKQTNKNHITTVVPPIGQLSMAAPDVTSQSSVWLVTWMPRTLNQAKNAWFSFKLSNCVTKKWISWQLCTVTSILYVDLLFAFLAP